MLASFQSKIDSTSIKDEWLENIMDEYGDKLTKLAFSYLKDWGKAQEVVQDVFLTCYQKYDTYDEIECYKAWIYRITVNRCKDVLRSSFFKKIIVTNTLFKSLTSHEHNPEEYFIRNTKDEYLIQSIFSLPVKYREVILFHYYEDLSIQEISEVLNINQNTIKTRLKRARGILGNFLKGSVVDEK